jgi:hypothetical protein
VGLTLGQNLEEKERIARLEKRNKNFLSKDLIDKIKNDGELMNLFLTNSNLDEEALFKRCKEIIMKHCFRNLNNMDSSELEKLKQSQDRYNVHI